MEAEGSPRGEVAQDPAHCPKPKGEGKGVYPDALAPGREPPEFQAGVQFPEPVQPSLAVRQRSGAPVDEGRSHKERQEMPGDTRAPELGHEHPGQGPHHNNAGQGGRLNPTCGVYGPDHHQQRGEEKEEGKPPLLRRD